MYNFAFIFISKQQNIFSILESVDRGKGAFSRKQLEKRCFTKR